MHWHMATPFVPCGAGELQRVFHYRAVTSMTADLSKAGALEAQHLLEIREAYYFSAG